ncbi:hypothetical protein J6590_043089 [Homalodisca vitripennis]|nr:hypothetical protein J6590_043089 [Homalodisca vitripennis]
MQLLLMHQYCRLILTKFVTIPSKRVLSLLWSSQAEISSQRAAVTRHVRVSRYLQAHLSASHVIALRTAWEPAALKGLLIKRYTLVHYAFTRYWGGVCLPPAAILMSSSPLSLVFVEVFRRFKNQC